MEKKTILIFCSKYDHDEQVEAISSYFKNKYKNCYVIAVQDDEYQSLKGSQISRWFNTQCKRNLPFLLKLNEKIQNMSYKKLAKYEIKRFNQEKEPNNSIDKYLFDLKHRYTPIRNILLRFNPDICLCLTKYSLEKIIKYKKKLKMPNINIFVLLNDFTLNKAFISNSIDKYLVQNTDVKQSLIFQNIADEKISVVNSIVNYNKLQKFDKAEARAELGIENNLPCIVFDCDYGGSSKIKNLFYKFLTVENLFNLIPYTYKNYSMEHYFSHVAKAKDKLDNVILVKDIESKSLLYSVADIIICPPNPVNVNKALYFDNLCILTQPNTSMENENINYLFSNELAIKSEDFESVLNQIVEYLENDDSEKEKLNQIKAKFLNKDSIAILCDTLFACANDYKTISDSKENATSALTN